MSMLSLLFDTGNAGNVNRRIGMRRWAFAVLPFLVILAGCGAATPSEGKDLPSLVQALREKAQDNARPLGGMASDADTLKRQILAREEAVDALVPLLKDPDKRVADLAAYMLRDAPTIDPMYLPQIIAGLDRDLGWLAPALARIDSDAAAKEAVDRYLVSESAPQNQEAYALQLLGRRAIPFMLERAACRQPCTSETHGLLGAALRGMGSDRIAAGPGLMRLATDPNASPNVVRGALIMIGELGVDGRGLEAELLRQREHAPHLSPWIDQALVGIQSPQAGRIFAERLARQSHEFTLRDLAEVGSAGRDAGPEVVAIFEREPALRAAAASTLGYIDYSKATPALVDALDDPVDVTVAWASARSLGRLGAREALAALERARDAHWYAPVRQAASEAVIAIRSGKSREAHLAGTHFPLDFFAFSSINRDLPQCDRYLDGEMVSSSDKLYSATAGDKLETLKYPAEVVSYGASDEDEQKEAGADIIRVHPGNLLEYRNSVQQVPHVAMRVEDGWLVGGNRGEWGGELVFVGDDGRFQTLLSENVGDIHRLGDRIVATTGLAHLGSSTGAIVTLDRQSTGQWQARPWRILPGAPGASVDTPDGLVVVIVGGGAIMLAADGNMRMADCPQ